MKYIVCVLSVVVCAVVAVGILYGRARSADEMQQYDNGCQERDIEVGERRVPKSNSVGGSLEGTKGESMPPEISVDKPESPGLPDQGTLSRMEEQMRLAASVFGVDFQKDLRSDTETEKPPFLGLVRELTLQDGRVLRFDLATGQLVTYRVTRLEDVPPDSTRDDAIGEGQALAAAKKLLGALDVDFEAEKMEFQAAAYGGVEAKEMLMGAEWVTRGSLKYKGIPYFGAGIRVALSAYSGRVDAYSCVPMGPAPSSLDEKISAAESAKIADTFLESVHTILTPTVEIGTPKKWIARSNNYWSRAQGEAIVQEDAAYLCWIVPVDNGRDFPIHVFVDALTGDIRGGF